MAEKLHQLIHALSKSEKRYFKLYAQRFIDNEDSLKIIIFDTVAAQQEYDETEVLLRIGSRYDKNRLSVEKVYLYELVLESLRSYHSKSFLEFEILQALQTIRILWLKGLTKAAQKLVFKYKKILYEELDNGSSSVSGYLLNLISLEKLLIYSVVPRPQQQTYIQQVLDEYDKSLKMLDENNRISSLIAKSNYLRNDLHCPRNPKLQDDVLQFLSDPFLQAQAEFFRSNSRLQCLRIRFHMAKLLKDYPLMVSLIDEVLKLLPPMQKHMEQSIINYCINAIAKMDAFLYYQHPDAEAQLLKVAEEIRQIPEKYGSKEKMHFSVYSSILDSYVIVLHFYILKNDTAKIRQSTEKLMAQMKEMPDIVEIARQESTNQTLYFDLHHTLSKAFFMLGEYSKAFDYNYFILNQGDHHFMAWDYRKALFFSLLIHFEMQHFRLLPYQIDKLENFLKKIEAPFQLEHLISRHLKKISGQVIGSKEQKKGFEQLLKKIDPLLKDPYEQMEQSDFDYWAWVRAKL